MKKPIHHGIIAFIAITAITFSSCSKSTKDLVINDQEIKNEFDQKNAGKKPNVPVRITEDSTTIFNEIKEPVDLTLGLPGSILNGGCNAVFFVKMSDEFAQGTVTFALLTTLDDNTGDPIGSYPLISYQEAGSYGIQVPAALIGTKYMFAIVDINDQYVDRTIALHSKITVKWGSYATTVRQFNNALSVIY